MRSIFFKVFITFIIAIFIIMIIMSTILIFGFRTTFNRWNSERLDYIKENIEIIFEELYASSNIISEEILRRNILHLLPGDVFLIIYDNNKKLLFTISKKKMARFHDFENHEFLLKTELIPFKINKNIKIYYSFHSFNLKEDLSNQKFLNSLQYTLIFSFFSSLFIAIFFALLFSKNISNQSKKVANGLDKIAQGNLNVHIDEKGTKEIAIIARSANILSKKLKKEEELRNQWAQDIAHDLRTPVAALKSQLEGIKDKVLDITDHRINRNLAEVEKIEFLINDLAELTKLESPEVKISKQKINLDDFFKDLLSTFESQIKKSGINIKLNLKIKEIIGDKRLLERAFSNIIHNAAKFTKKNGLIDIKSEGERGSRVKYREFLTIKIFNSDSYISQDEKDKIFDRLYRGEFARNTKGTGLGLTIAKKIIELHDGSIEIDSQKNKGTTFIVKFSMDKMK